MKPLGNKISPEDENKYNEELVLAKPTAVRHLFLIRHGQYNLKGKSDSERRLTELGIFDTIFFIWKYYIKSFINLEQFLIKSI